MISINKILKYIMAVSIVLIAFSIVVNATTEISNCTELQDMSSSGDYYLTQDINCSDTVNWNYNCSGNGIYCGFNPIGDEDNEFTGSFNGSGYVVSDLYINRESEDNIGLFGSTEGSLISNIGLIDVNITGGVSTTGKVGSLVGENWDHAKVVNSYSTGSVKSDTRAVGGLIGYHFYYSVVENSYSTASASSNDGQVGGLVGYSDGNVSECYATGSVSGAWDVGVLVGRNDGYIGYSYSTGNFIGDQSGTVEGSGSRTVEEMIWEYSNTYDGWNMEPYESHANETWKSGDHELVQDHEGNTGYPALHFQEIKYNLTVYIDGEGSTTPEPGTHTYVRETEVNLTAAPDADYEFTEWTGDTAGIANTSSPNTTITMNNNYNITANFQEAGVEQVTAKPTTAPALNPTLVIILFFGAITLYLFKEID